ncbi:hypothetical protein M0Q39_06240 [Patescibacteria group bacterium]|nr:hypothetical protein [Patescibacteria group bacterium]
MKLNIIYLGNNLEILKTFPDNSVDCVVTDPPYGLGKEPNAVEVLKSWITTGYHEVKGKGFMGKEWDAFVPQPIFWKEVYRVLKPGGYVLSFAGTRTYDWMVMAVRLAGFEIRDMIAWLYGSGFPKSHDISKAIDKSMGAKREVVGKHQRPAKSIYTQAQVEMSKDVNITAPSTEEAKQWQGWGTALKPALEPIVMARKPLDGTVAQNVLKHGVGGINIDESRIDFISEEDKGDPLRFQTNNGSGSHGIFNASKDVTSVVGEKGRWPANVIHDGSDEVVELFPDTNPSSSGGISSGRNFGQNYDDESIKKLPRTGYDDNGGSASRFFYTAKARISAVKDYEATLDTKTIIKESIKEDKEKELGIQNIFDFL